MEIPDWEFTGFVAIYDGNDKNLAYNLFLRKERNDRRLQLKLLGNDGDVKLLWKLLTGAK